MLECAHRLAIAKYYVYYAAMKINQIEGINYKTNAVGLEIIEQQKRVQFSHNPFNAQSNSPSVISKLNRSLTADLSKKSSPVVDKQIDQSFIRNKTQQIYRNQALSDKYDLQSLKSLKQREHGHGQQNSRIQSLKAASIQCRQQYKSNRTVNYLNKGVNASENDNNWYNFASVGKPPLKKRNAAQSLNTPSKPPTENNIRAWKLHTEKMAKKHKHLSQAPLHINKNYTTKQSYKEQTVCTDREQQQRKTYLETIRNASLRNHKTQEFPWDYVQMTINTKGYNGQLPALNLMAQRENVANNNVNKEISLLDDQQDMLEIKQQPHNYFNNKQLQKYGNGNEEIALQHEYLADCSTAEISLPQPQSKLGETLQVNLQQLKERYSTQFTEMSEFSKCSSIVQRSMSSVSVQSSSIQVSEEDTVVTQTPHSCDYQRVVHRHQHTQDKLLRAQSIQLVDTEQQSNASQLNRIERRSSSCSNKAGAQNSINLPSRRRYVLKNQSQQCKAKSRPKSPSSTHSTQRSQCIDQIQQKESQTNATNRKTHNKILRMVSNTKDACHAQTMSKGQFADSQTKQLGNSTQDNGVQREQTNASAFNNTLTQENNNFHLLQNDNDCQNDYLGNTETVGQFDQLSPWNEQSKNSILSEIQEYNQSNLANTHKSVIQDQNSTEAQSTHSPSPSVCTEPASNLKRSFSPKKPSKKSASNKPQPKTKTNKKRSKKGSKKAQQNNQVLQSPKSAKQSKSKQTVVNKQTKAAVRVQLEASTSFSSVDQELPCTSQPLKVNLTQLHQINADNLITQQKSATGNQVIEKLSYCSDISVDHTGQDKEPTGGLHEKQQPPKYEKVDSVVALKSIDQQNDAEFRLQHREQELIFDDQTSETTSSVQLTNDSQHNDLSSTQTYSTIVDNHLQTIVNDGLQDDSVAQLLNEDSQDKYSLDHSESEIQLKQQCSAGGILSQTHIYEFKQNEVVQELNLASLASHNQQNNRNSCSQHSTQSSVQNPNPQVSSLQHKVDVQQSNKVKSSSTSPRMWQPFKLGTVSLGSTFLNGLSSSNTLRCNQHKQISRSMQEQHNPCYAQGNLHEMENYQNKLQPQTQNIQQQNFLDQEEDTLSNASYQRTYADQSASSMLPNSARNIVVSPRSFRGCTDSKQPHVVPNISNYYKHNKQIQRCSKLTSDEQQNDGDCKQQQKQNQDLIPITHNSVNNDNATHLSKQQNKFNSNDETIYKQGLVSFREQGFVVNSLAINTHQLGSELSDSERRQLQDLEEQITQIGYKNKQIIGYTQEDTLYVSSCAEPQQASYCALSSFDDQPKNQSEPHLDDTQEYKQSNQTQPNIQSDLQVKLHKQNGLETMESSTQKEDTTGQMDTMLLTENGNGNLQSTSGKPTYQQNLENQLSQSLESEHGEVNTEKIQHSKQQLDSDDVQSETSTGLQIDANQQVNDYKIPAQIDFEQCCQSQQQSSGIIEVHGMQQILQDQVLLDNVPKVQQQSEDVTSKEKEVQKYSYQLDSNKSKPGEFLGLQNLLSRPPSASVVTSPNRSHRSTSTEALSLIPQQGYTTQQQRKLRQLYSAQLKVTQESSVALQLHAAGNLVVESRALQPNSPTQESKLIDIQQTLQSINNDNLSQKWQKPAVYVIKGTLKDLEVIGQQPAVKAGISSPTSPSYDSIGNQFPRDKMGTLKPVGSFAVVGNTSIVSSPKSDYRRDYYCRVQQPLKIHKSVFNGMNKADSKFSGFVKNSSSQLQPAKCVQDATYTRSSSNGNSSQLKDPQQNNIVIVAQIVKSIMKMRQQQTVSVQKILAQATINAIHYFDTKSKQSQLENQVRGYCRNMRSHKQVLETLINICKCICKFDQAKVHFNSDKFLESICQRLALPNQIAQLSLDIRQPNMRSRSAEVGAAVNYSQQEPALRLNQNNNSEHPPINSIKRHSVQGFIKTNIKFESQKHDIPKTVGEQIQCSRPKSSHSTRSSPVKIRLSQTGDLNSSTEKDKRYGQSKQAVKDPRAELLKRLRLVTAQEGQEQKRSQDTKHATIRKKLAF